MTQLPLVASIVEIITLGFTSLFRERIQRLPFENGTRIGDLVSKKGNKGVFLLGASGHINVLFLAEGLETDVFQQMKCRSCAKRVLLHDIRLGNRRLSRSVILRHIIGILGAERVVVDIILQKRDKQQEYASERYYWLQQFLM